MKSLKSETDDGLSSCLNFPERATPEKLVMDKPVLPEIEHLRVMCYVNDVVIATPTLEDQIERLNEVFACMKRAGLKCKPSKCEIMKDSIEYLGRMVDKHDH